VLDFLLAKIGTQGQVAMATFTGDDKGLIPISP